jgi:inorganic pyrophosphatase
MTFPKPFYRWRPHPWHGLDAGSDPPRIVNAFIEITPFDVVKYEVDKTTGYTRVDRPQRTSSQPPALYGFIPRTFAGPRVGALMPDAGRGDSDPLDICVFSERPINRSEVIVSAKVVGGLEMIDGGEADDKIIAVLENDTVWKDVEDVAELPEVLVERLRHYFSTYKLVQAEDAPVAVEVRAAYGREHAEKVIVAAIEDYEEQYGGG